MQVTLSAEMQAVVERQIEAGRFATPNDVIEESLTALFWSEMLDTAQADALRASIRVGVDELDRGEGLDADAVFARLTEQIAMRTRE